MELLCPQCQQRLTIPDQYAGQVMRCPLCNGTFTAPALTASPPPVPPVQDVPPPVFSAPPPSVPYELLPAVPPPLPPEPARAPKRDTGIKEGAPPPPRPLLPPPGDYTHSFKIGLSPRIVPWITPVGLFLAFVLTFFPWVRVFDLLPANLLPANALPATAHPNAWTLGFGDHSNPLVGVYVLLLLVAMIVSIPSALFALNIVPAPPAIKALGIWRPVIVGGVALLAFLFFVIHYLNAVFLAAPATVWFKLAFRCHLVAVIAALLEFWLELRRRKNLPLPRIDVNW
jgi:hypothetical protein